jgi:hypothetical protein
MCASFSRRIAAAASSTNAARLSESRQRMLLMAPVLASIPST